MKKNSNVLGRGLSAILGNSKKIDEDFISTGMVKQTLISEIEKNPFQPREEFSSEKIAELAISIKDMGIIQPITIRQVSTNKYQLISGERRLEACKSLNFKEIPAYVRIADDENMLKMALVENIQRQNLNPIEIALSVKRLINECKITQEECSSRIGKKRSTIANYLRLLKLPVKIQSALKKRIVSIGHVRPLINISDNEKQINIFSDIINKKLSVREVEEIVKVFAKSNYSGKKISKVKNNELEFSFTTQKNIFELEKKISSNFSIKKLKNGSGEIKIKFKNEIDLNRIIKLMNE
ncbi:ParB/RepB/Spo0J family partition protein [Bacteroidota bacterium]|nr:ParB/RepB/Spo0J family partition protein [Bacteroidota bacterium]